MYEAVYTKICADKNETNNTAYGTVEHARRLFGALASDELFRLKGERVAMKRWFGWYAGFRTFRPKWHLMLLCLTFLGLKEGWYNKDDELPVFGVGGPLVNSLVREPAFVQSSLPCIQQIQGNL